MKVTRKELRRLIEGIFVGDTDGTVLSPKDVDDFEYSGQAKDDEALGRHPKLDQLLKSPNIQSKKQGRDLAVSLGYQDDLTPYEELAVDHLDPKDIHSPDTPVEHPDILRDPKVHKIQAVITKDFKNYLTSPEAERYAKLMFGSISRGHASTHGPGTTPKIEWDILSHRYSLIDNPNWFNLQGRIFNKLGYGSDSMFLQLSVADAAMYRALSGYLMDKLNKIATNTFNEEYMKVIGGQEAGGSFPLALTEAELRRLVVEAFIGQQGAPPIKIRTDASGGLNPYAIPVRKVSTNLTPESLDAILGRFISDYDSIKQLPQDEQYQAMLDRGYNIKIEDFLNYGGRIKVLAMSDDEGNRMMALNLGSTLGLFDMDSEGLTGEDLVDAEIMGQQLLKDPKFADIGNVAVREDEYKDADMQHITYLLNSDNLKERSLGVSKLSGALKNDNFKEQIRRKIDSGFKKALPHIKESILDEVAYQIQTYGGDPRRKDLYDGMDIDEFAEENDHAIMGTLGGDFTAFQEIDTLFDSGSGLNEINELVNYFYELSIKSIKIAIKDLIDAGLLKRGAQDNSFIMTMQDYYDIINRRRGDAYVPSPNLPVVTEEIIRQIIREAIFIGGADGTVLSPKDVDDFEYSGVQKDDMSRGYHHKLDALRDTDPKQARSLAVSLGLQDDLTSYEELAVDHIDDNLIHSPETPIEHSPLQNRKAHRIQLELTKEFKQFLNSPEGAELARTIVEKYIKSFPNRLPHPEEIAWVSYLLANNSPKPAGFNLKSRIYRKLGLDADDGYIVDPQTRVMFQELNHHLLLKLRAIAIKRFDSNHIKAVKAQMGVEKFPLALTEAELKQIIMEELAERKKRKKKKKKKTKSKKRGYLYPYVYGHHDHDFHDYGYDVSDGGFDVGGDGGGGE